MANYKARINQDANLKSKVKGNPDKIVAQTLKVGNVGLSDLTDVNPTNLGDGAILQYNAASAQWDAKTLVDNGNLTITGGVF
jgi:hypothetical protein|tara:strand:- start:578 stop:823 length:246 start_codon:yes stop_codon:yes gene_type:complete